MRFNDISIGDLIEAHAGGMYANAGVGAPVTMNLPCGPGGQTRPCVTNGIYLVREDTDRLAIMFKPAGLGMRHTEVNLQVIGTSQDRAAQVLREIRALALERSVFRGQVISFGPELLGPATGSTPLTFLPRPSVSRGEIVLPGELLADIERQVAGVARHSARLLASGQHLKRGVLLYGAPGVGKTHTVRYLMGRLPQTTVLMLSGNVMHLIRQACSVARTLQPSLLIVEDVDLIGEERGVHQGNNPLLFQLLNEMDGLGEDVDVTFLLTTNRVDVLEPALVARPGRIDHAVEIPLPDALGRRRLLEVYQGTLDLDLAEPDRVIERTEGVTASFIKELLRRAALTAADEADDAAEALAIEATAQAAESRPPLRVTDAHLHAALDVLLDDGNRLTRRLLGARATDHDMQQS
jgi:hypothetical protein